MKITLIRHGRPSFPLKGMARSRDISSIIANYDRSGIIDKPPSAAMAMATDCNAVFCSDLTRSQESARALGFTDIQNTDALFREVAAPHFKSGSITLPVGVWAFLSRTLSMFGFSRNGESMAMARHRAALAADSLIEAAQQHEHILLVGHGFINHHIARELLARNWQGPKKPGRNYWQFGVYTNNNPYRNKENVC